MGALFTRRGCVLIDMAGVLGRAPWGERILGSRLDPVSKAEAARLVVERALSGDPGAYVCLTNVHTTVESQRSPALRTAVDGVPLRAGRHAAGLDPATARSPQDREGDGHRVHPPRCVSGPRRRVRHFFYGGAPGVAEEAARRLSALVPGVQVVGTVRRRSPASARWPVEDLEEELRRTKPHILWVGLGAPKQELWMAKMAAEDWTSR